MQSIYPIELLSQTVIEKIAAGEVIERPAAVIKELVENSIDAGATSLEITVEDAGFSLIKVIDNGIGMSRRDLSKCMLRHATSKIRTVDDLFSIGTLGFRGEALGSIAAISRMSIISALQDDGEGYLLSSEGGVFAGEVIPHPHRRGTTVTVKDLFFNIPARKKFMKTHRGEHLAVIRMLEQLVVPFPSIHFTLHIDDRVIFNLPVVDRCIERIADVAGAQYASALIECRGERQHMDTVVYVSSPGRLQGRPRFQSLYVNLRRIDNDTVTYSVREAFARFLGHHHRPAFFCFLTIDPSCIDVNVHPTKQQIKFDNEREIFSFLFSTVKNGIEATMAGCKVFEKGSQPGERQATAISGEEIPDPGLVRVPIVEEKVPRTEKEGTETSDRSGRSRSADDGGRTILSFPDGRRVEKEVDPLQDTTIQLTGDVHERMWDLIPCYQIHATFILAPIKNGILLIDQHAAHERILFEQAMEKSAGIQTTSQQLLFPIVVELTPSEKGIVESGKEFFLRFGFEIADFGGRTISISAIPAFIKDGMAESIIREMVSYLLQGRGREHFSEPHKRFAAAFACGAAIKAGQKLTQEEMNTLLNNLFSTQNPYICPHGRPTLIRMSLDELSRRFLR
ncbi:MAG: DNA mismatch repair endonuclease MutL [Chitinispirillaceae bacterium]|nr:DNA mismatch repair endonuclease MutL [Chitinispirillaceae bacterium]